MLARIESKAICGISAYDIDIEVDVSSGLPNFSIVGLPDASCRESSKRVMAALKNSGFQLPSRHITVNLAPAYIKKEGSMYDIGIAVGILAAMEKLDKRFLEDKVICGELSLDGTLRPIKGGLVIADSLKNTAKKELIISSRNLPEVSIIKGIKVTAANSLNEVLAYLIKGIEPGFCGNSLVLKNDRVNVELDYADIKGSVFVKRALEIAAAGGHNIILIGPPGCGKTMLARRLPTILDELTEEESIATSKIYSVAGLLNNDLIRTPPFRILHHTISDAGMIGGGNGIRPGEISLAHNGVLFLDEAAEFRRDVLEALRQPLEDGLIRISRANMSVAYPAQFMLVAAMNPCPCGFLTHPDKGCTCTPFQIQRYLSKISGPLLDRIDMHIEVQPIRYEQMRKKDGGETSKAIRERVKMAHKVQQLRYKDYNFKLNAQIPQCLLDKVCVVTEEACDLLKKAMLELYISARAYAKILKVARTIADLDNKPIIDMGDISEALGYRSLDTKIWTS